MTALEVWTGWLAMPWGERLAFVDTLVTLGIIKADGRARLVNAREA